jgi:hypothetical protein
MPLQTVNKEKTRLTEWVAGGRYVVAVEIEATILPERPGGAFPDAPNRPIAGASRPRCSCRQPGGVTESRQGLCPIRGCQHSLAGVTLAPPRRSCSLPARGGIMAFP